MGLTTRMAAAAAKHDEKQYAKLEERHRGILAPGETITSMVTVVRPETPQASAVFWGAIGGLAGYFIGNAIDRPKARARAMAVREHLGAPFAHFPESKNGYKIATTQLRVLVFDGKAKELVSEGPIGAMSVSSIAHNADLSSIIFSNGTEHIAVTSARGYGREVEVFVAAFPQSAGSAHPHATPPQAMPPSAMPAPATAYQAAPAHGTASGGVGVIEF